MFKRDRIFLVLCLYLLVVLSLSETLASDKIAQSARYTGNTESINFEYESENINLIGRWPYGPNQAVKMDGSYAHIGNGSAYQILDVSEPASAFPVGEIDLNAFIVDIALHPAGTVAYIVSKKGLHIVDISSNTRPVFVNEILDYPAEALRVKVLNNLLFIAAGPLHIYSVSDAGNPVHLKTYSDGEDIVTSVEAAGSYAFVGHAEEDIHVLDISDAANPVLRSTLAHTNIPKDMIYYSNYLFVAQSADGLLQFDLTNVYSPFLHSSLDTEGSAGRMDIKNSHLFLANGPKSLKIIDLRSLINPSIRESVTIVGNAMDVSVTDDGNYTMVAGYEEGLVMVNTEYIPSAFYQHYYNTPGELTDVFLAGNYAYLAATDGMYILNIANPDAPYEESFYNIDDEPVYSITVRSNTAYLGREGVIESVDITSRSNPVALTKSSYHAGRNNDIFDAIAYLATAAGSVGLRNWGTDPHPYITFEGSRSSDGYAQGVVTFGSWAFIANRTGGVTVINNSDIEDPIYVGNYAVDGQCSYLNVYENMLFIPYWGTKNGINIYDIRYNYPHDLLTSFAAEGSPSDVDLIGSTGYYVSQSEGIRAFDISDIFKPKSVGLLHTGNDPQRVFVEYENMVLLDRTAGLYFFEEHIPPAAPYALLANGENPSPWQTSNAFNISWNNPFDQNGINQVKYKTGNPPGSNEDFTGTLPPTSPQTITIDKEGITPLHVWLVDGKGAESYMNTAVVDLRYDSSVLPPRNFQETHEVENNAWQNFSDRASFTWDDPPEFSGIAEYRIYFGPDADGEEVHATSLTPAYNTQATEGISFLRLEVEDSLGNILPWRTYFTFKYDQTNPRNPTTINETNSIPNNVWQNTQADPMFTWSGHSDALSGIRHFLAYFGHQADGETEIQLRDPALNPPPATNQTRYLRLAVEDSAGNHSPTFTAFVYRHDALPPINPGSVTDGSANGSENDVWQNVNDDPNFIWQDDPGMDTLSGVQGYYYYWGRDPQGTSTTNFTQFMYFDPSFVDTGAHFFRIKTIDNVGNSAPWELAYTFLYDNVKPSVNANTKPYSATGMINIDWMEGQDRGGSGLSGRYDIRIRENDGEWQRWRTNYEGTKLDTTGRHGHSYHFEVAGRDHAGNVEEFTGIPEASTEVDTTLADSEAPDMPINLTANGFSPSPWFNASEFELVWTNPEDLSGISAAYFKLDAPPTDANDYTDKRTGTPPVYVTATREGGQNLYLWLEDGNGNSDFNNHAMIELRMDQTPPEGITALSRSVIDSLEFIVTWSMGTDEGGSGLSNIYDVNVKTDLGSWQPWKTGFEGNQAIFTNAVHNHTYSFEARGYDIAGNREEFTGTPESVTFVDTTAEIDYVPPQAPDDLSALPGNWNNENDFSLSWTNPTGDDVISGAYYKVGAPASDQDGTFIAGNITAIHGITLPGEGTFTVYVWLRDLAGNLTHTNTANVQIGFDETTPDIGHTAITTNPAGSGITISAHAEETLSGLNHFYLNYCKTGDHAGLISADFSGDQAVIPAAAVTQRGVEYAIVADDLAGNKSSLPASGFFLIQTEVGGDGGILRNESGEPLALHDGNTINDYRLFSVPLDLVDKKPKSVFEDDLDAYDPKIWRLYDIDDETLIEYPSFADQPVMHPGKAFLLILNVPGKIVDSGPGVSANAASYRQINLQSGWNLVGNPFDYDIPVDSLSVSVSPAPIWYLGNTGWISNPPLLKKWEGVAIDVDTDAILTIALGGGSGSRYAVTDRFAGDNWGVRIQAIGSDSRDTDNFFGVYATMPEDDLILMKEPPRLAGSVALHARAEKALNKPVSNTDKTRYAMILKEKNDQGYTWNLYLEGEEAGDDIRLEYEQFGDIPEEFQLFLIDPVFKMAYDLSETEAIDTKILHDNTHRFKLVAGTADYVQSQAEGISLSPLSFDLRPNFPNPFNPDTRIIFTLPDEQKISLEVFNLLGQKIRTLYDNRILKAGYHMTGWDGRNEAGNRVASGLYVIRLRSGKDVKLRKAILMR